MKLFTNEQQKLYENEKMFYICKENFEDRYARGDFICNLKYGILEKIIIIFHDESDYDYHFIIKELAEESEGLFNLFTRKY